MVSLRQIQEVPPRRVILLVGPPGSGKSTFCEQTVLSNIEMRPIIYVTTELDPSEVAESFKERGLGGVLPHPLGFVDAFHETVGLPSVPRDDSIDASSQDLNSLGIAISKLQEKMGENYLLVFDSLTSPYLMNGSEVIRFMKLSLSKLAAQGNAVLACIDEGCGKQEDLVAMMSTADGIVKIELMDSTKTIRVVKHPKLKPAKVEVPMTWSSELSYRFHMEMVAESMQLLMGLMSGPPLRREVGDYVNLFWPNFARWCGMLWDPKRFPMMTYKSSREIESTMMPEFLGHLPLRMRMFVRFIPKDFSEPRNMKKFLKRMEPLTRGDRSGILEYLDKPSKADMHYGRGYENAECCGLENVGTTLSLGIAGGLAGVLQGFEKYRGGPDREWNIVETKCIGLGDPYCEAKIVAGEIDELKDSLESVDSTIMERIHDRLVRRLMGFMLEGKPLVERPRLGSEIGLHWFGHIMGSDVAIVNERHRMAMRLGGVRGGKAIGERLMEAGVKEDEAIRRMLDFLRHCKVGKISMGDTLIMYENCESFTMKGEEPSCFFTTGFLNGFFSAVKNQHVKETKCIAMGSPYCEWEII